MLQTGEALSAGWSEGEDADGGVRFIVPGILVLLLLLHCNDCAQLNSSLVPGGVFNCHLELVLDSSDSGTGSVVMEIQW